MNPTPKSQWKTIDRFVEINSHWVKLIAEHLETTEGQIVEYWRVERADSVVILTIQAEKFLFPTSMYRPGVASATLDFPGGRVPAQVTPAAAVPAIMNPQLYIPFNQNLAIANRGPGGAAKRGPPSRPRSRSVAGPK